MSATVFPEDSNAASLYSILKCAHPQQVAQNLPCNASGLALDALLTYAMTGGEFFPIRLAHQRRQEKFFTGS